MVVLERDFSGIQNREIFKSKSGPTFQSKLDSLKLGPNQGPRRFEKSQECRPLILCVWAISLFTENEF